MLSYSVNMLRYECCLSDIVINGVELQIKKALRGVKVEVTHRGNMRRKYRIANLTSQATRELTYVCLVLVIRELLHKVILCVAASCGVSTCCHSIFLSEYL